ncbi:tryptophan-rich sensory protein [Arthrobacter sulfonylureivorans]|uniref:tryptophan-rich sensory protein n=1 Tax=Arthrobacter sulfonylureivorans TaxID=2486855 RepID=UPI0039E510F7
MKPETAIAQPVAPTTNSVAGNIRTMLATDLARQCAVTGSLLLCLLAGLRGAGLLGGTGIKDAASGAFAPDFTLLALEPRAFSIWAVIYLGLLGYTLFQWWPVERASQRQRRIGWVVAASMLLNAAWILAAQAGNVGLTLVLILLLVAALAWIVDGLTRYPSPYRVDTLLVDGPLGLYTGWVLLAAALNASSWLTIRGIDWFGWSGELWAVIAVAVVSLAGAVVAMTGRGRISTVLALAWGLGWLAYDRFLGQPESAPVAMAAGFGLFFVLVCGISRHFQVGHAERRALRRGEPLD